MSKYIDAEKLIAEIERRKKQDVTFRERSLLIDMENAIASLQHEHPYFDKVREIKTGRVFLAEYSSEAAEWYEAGTGKAYSISDVEIVKQEQPKGGCSEKPNNLTSNLDEAAEKYSENILANNEDLQDAIGDAFRAGAEWMAGQGVTKEAVIGMATEEISINVSKQTLNELDLCPGDKVVVQIRKK